MNKFVKNGLLAIRIIVVASTLVGCVSVKPNPESTSAKSFREFAKAYQDASLAVIDKMLKADSLQQGDGYIADTLRWCMLPPELTKYKDDLRQYCSNHGGQWSQRDFCIAPTGQVMYMAKVTEQGACNPAVDRTRVETKVLESTQNPNSSAYRHELAKFGFKTAADLQNDAALRQKEAAERAAVGELKDQQHQADLPSITRKGASVCASRNRTIIHGWVEDYSEPNLKIRIHGWSNINSRQIYRFPTEQIIWEHHHDWSLCQ